MPTKPKTVLPAMTGVQMVEFRTRRGLSRQALADLLGLGIQSIKDYEKGERVSRTPPSPRPAPIPRHVELAMAALELGVTSYDGRALRRSGKPPEGNRPGRPVGSKYAGRTDEGT